MIDTVGRQDIRRFIGIYILYTIEWVGTQSISARVSSRWTIENSDEVIGGLIRILIAPIWDVIYYIIASDYR